MWRCAGLRWRDGGPVWLWWHPGHGERTSAQPVGGRLTTVLAPDADRRCIGVWRAGRRIACADAAALPYGARRDQCEACAALDRSSSVAADTRADDPRPFAVYLAYFGPGVHKVGITAVARGSARLLEQGAVAFAFLGEGPLMAARRTEAVLGAALGVPDRVGSAVKRAARLALPAGEERATSLRTLHAAALGLGGALPEALRTRAFAVIDHAERFGLDPGRGKRLPVAEVTALGPGDALAGVVAMAAGHDLEVLADDGRVLLVDARLLSGWTFRRSAEPADPAALRLPPTRPLAVPPPAPDPLFPLPAPLPRGRP